MLKPVRGGYKIVNESGRVYPKVYKTKEKAEARVAQMVKYSKPKEDK